MEDNIFEQKKRTESSFLMEMKDDVEKRYGQFQRYQKITAEAFSVFHEICVKNNIPYYMAFGSLLGAIRDGGQIPWDYDIDVLVPYSRANDLIAALDHDLPDRYYYDTRLKNDKCRHYGIKLSPKEYNCSILHVDIFWLIGESDEEKDQKKHLRIRRLFFKKFLYKYPDTGILSKGTKAAKMMFYFNRFRYGLLPGAWIERKYLNVLAVPVDTDGWCATSGREKVILRNKWFGTPQIKYLDNGQQVLIPNDTESILKAMYGDYSSYPTLSQRVREFERSLKRLNKFAKKAKQL